ncbi:hypothetical protein QYE76_024783 [Lolium multiflorum]|uniref:Dof zinc finger protein n=1 Tax=Lolium multiflorum TaxID=4521 RepID=A0AAD8VVC5_LOLMU|nr:hypothetical protein QYE76_024783 [Lolium multiflorum]
MMAGAAHPMHFCMDSDWLKGIVPEDQGGMGSSSPSEELIIACPEQVQAQQAAADRRLRPQHDQPLKCPRCDSAHTKFCYYNNYSLSQPRYFCKTCRRYWTKGGSLRNVPVGGGCRKNKRASASKKSSATTVTSPISMMPLHQYSRQMAETGLHLSFSGMMPPVTAADPLSSLGLLDWNKYDHILSGSSGFGSANSEAHFTGTGMMGMSSGGGDSSVATEYHALNALRYAAGLGEHLSLPFGSASRADQRDATVVEMKPPAERLLSLEWCGEASRAPPESSMGSLGGLGLWSGMINSAAHHHHGSSAAI